jgi:hypothetical protein
MKTDLAHLFHQVASFSDNLYQPFGPVSEKDARVDEFIAKLLAKEFADYRAEIMSLEENPWYFAWRLRQKVV